MKTNVKLTIAYDGSDFAGWQRQPEKATVQGFIEQALKIIFKEDISLVGAGRTDAGVHALKQVATFTTTQDVNPTKVAWQLNSLLPTSISIKECQLVSLNFHPRYQAKRRTYYYYLLNSRYRFPFWHKYCWWIARPLNWEQIKACLPIFLGEHNFASFTVNQEKNTVRTVYEFSLEPQFFIAEGLYKFSITADGFLHHMVRLIVGTLVWVGTGKLKPEQVKQILAAKDIRLAGPKAPARGLFLASIEY